MKIREYKNINLYICLKISKLKFCLILIRSFIRNLQKNQFRKKETSIFEETMTKINHLCISFYGFFLVSNLIELKKI